MESISTITVYKFPVLKSIKSAAAKSSGNVNVFAPLFKTVPPLVAITNGATEISPFTSILKFFSNAKRSPEPLFIIISNDTSSLGQIGSEKSTSVMETWANVL